MATAMAMATAMLYGRLERLERNTIALQQRQDELSNPHLQSQGTITAPDKAKTLKDFLWLMESRGPIFKQLLNYIEQLEAQVSNKDANRINVCIWRTSGIAINPGDLVGIHDMTVDGPGPEPFHSSQVSGTIENLYNLIQFALPLVDPIIMMIHKHPETGKLEVGIEIYDAKRE